MKKIIITTFLIGVSFAVNAQTGEKTENQTPPSAQNQSPREGNNEKTPTTRTASSNNQPVEAPQPKKTQSVPETGETTTPKPAENNSNRSSGKRATATAQ